MSSLRAPSEPPSHSSNPLPDCMRVQARLAGVQPLPDPLHAVLPAGGKGRREASTTTPDSPTRACSRSLPSTHEPLTAPPTPPMGRASTAGQPGRRPGGHDVMELLAQLRERIARADALAALAVKAGAARASRAAASHAWLERLKQAADMRAALGLDLEPENGLLPALSPSIQSAATFIQAAARTMLDRLAQADAAASLAALAAKERISRALTLLTTSWRGYVAHRHMHAEPPTPQLGPPGPPPACPPAEPLPVLGRSPPNPAATALSMLRPTAPIFKPPQQPGSADLLRGEAESLMRAIWNRGAIHSTTDTGVLHALVNSLARVAALPAEHATQPSSALAPQQAPPPSQALPAPSTAPQQMPPGPVQQLRAPMAVPPPTPRSPFVQSRGDSPPPQQATPHDRRTARNRAARNRRQRRRQACSASPLTAPPQRAPPQQPQTQQQQPAQASRGQRAARTQRAARNRRETRRQASSASAPTAPPQQTPQSKAPLCRGAHQTECRRTSAAAPRGSTASRPSAPCRRSTGPHSSAPAPAPAV